MARGGRERRRGAWRHDLEPGHSQLSPLRGTFGRAPRAPGRARRPGRAQARPLHDNLVGAVREAVEGAVGQDRIVEEGHPLVYGTIAREDGGTPTVPLDEDVIEVTGLLGRELPESEIIELCGAPHNSTNGERSVMWSAAAPPQESSAFSSLVAAHYSRHRAPRPITPPGGSDAQRAVPQEVPSVSSRSRCSVRSPMTSTRGYRTQGYRPQRPSGSTRGRWSGSIVISAGTGHRQWRSVRQADLDACWTRYRREIRTRPATVRGLRRFLQARSCLPARPPAVTRVATLAKHLRRRARRSPWPGARRPSGSTSPRRRSSSPTSTTRSGRSASPRSPRPTWRPSSAGSAQRLSRATLQHRSRSSAASCASWPPRGRVRPGLDQPDRYPARLSPGAAAAQSAVADRPAAVARPSIAARPQGLRDYTMLFLIATYGLRACEVVALTLDAIDWRGRRLHVPQRKTGPPWSCRSRMPPGRSCSATCVGAARRRRIASCSCASAPRPGSSSPPPSARSFRNGSGAAACRSPSTAPTASATRTPCALLRRGVGLKTLGDLLGHRTAESTCAYLRLATDDLRDVALSLPRAAAARGRRMSAPAGASAAQRRDHAVPRAEDRLGPPVRARAARARDARGVPAAPDAGPPRRSHAGRRFTGLGPDAPAPDARRSGATTSASSAISVSIAAAPSPPVSSPTAPSFPPRTSPGPPTSSRRGEIARLIAGHRHAGPDARSVPSARRSSASRWSSSTPRGSAAASSSG